MSKLLATYEKILGYAGCAVGSDGYVAVKSLAGEEPLMIDGARVCLPTDDHLRLVNPTEKVVFHPLRENIGSGESKVVSKLRDVIKVRLNTVIGVLAVNLLQLAASPELHKNLSPDQLDLAITLKDANEKTVKAFVQMLVAGAKLKPGRMFVDIYLNRGGTIRGQRYSRAGVVSFPFLKDIDESLDRLYGVKWPNAKDRETVKKLFLFILPRADVQEEYSEGSTSNIAPFLEALLRSSQRVAARTNDLVATYGEFIDDAASLEFDAGWQEDFDQLDTLVSEIRRTPPQAGNEGHVPQTAATPQTQQTQKQFVVPDTPVVHQLAQAEQQTRQVPQQKNNTGAVSFSEVFQQPQQQCQPQSQMQFNQLQPGTQMVDQYGRPVMVVPVQQYQQQQVMQQAPMNWATAGLMSGTYQQQQMFQQYNPVAPGAGFIGR